MQNHSIWSYILSILVSLFFVVSGIQMFLAQQYAFGIIWMLLTGTFLYRSIQGLLQELHRRKQTNDEIQEDVTSYSERPANTFIEKERLEKLEQLYQSGLISKEEYQEKRTDILNDL